jgi:C1A family cysteine protease
MSEFEMQDRPEQLNLESVVNAIKNTGANWYAHEDEITEVWTPENRRRLLGAMPPGGIVALRERSVAARARLAAKGISAMPPRKQDWRNHNNKNYVAPVQRQGNCGSCVAFGVCATAEGVYRVNKNLPDDKIDISEAHLFYCHGAQERRTCDLGWWPDRALNWFQNSGIVPEACFPYTPGDQPCTVCEEPTHTYKIAKWKVLTATSEMKTAIEQNGPLIACLEVFDDLYYYSRGIYRHVTGESLGGHCVSCVGFDDGSRAWICKNSWGQTWGDNGYFSISYGECGIDSEMWQLEDVSVVKP